LYAPVLVHSCEEVWEQLRLAEKETSVHLAPWPEPPGAWSHPTLGARYERLLTVRGAVNRALERLRESGTIGRSLDGRVTIHSADPVLRDWLAAADLASLFIVSEAELVDQPVGVEDAELAGVWVQAERSAHDRCERCWARRASVGRDAAEPDLCDRCLFVVRSEG
jgi:isoleucyl-tRNA synthetase